MLFIIFFMSSSLFAKEVYYRFADYSINYNIVGKYEITKEESEEEFGYKFTYDSNNNLILVNYIGKLSILMPSFFNASQIKIERSKNSERRIFLNRGLAFKNNNGVYIEHIEYMNDGRIKNIFNYNRSNEMVRDRYDVSYYHFLYDNEREFSVYRFNESGIQIKDLNNVYFTKISYDHSKLVKTVLYYDENGYISRSKNGTCGFRLTYDANHNLIKEEYLDKSAYTVSNPFSVATKIYHYDVDGKVIEILNYDINNNLTPDENNVAIYRYEYYFKDKDCYYKEYNYDNNNNLTISQNGYAMKKTIFYIQNNEKRIINYSNKINKNYNRDIPTVYEEKYEIMDNFKGIAIYSYKYDDKFYLIENIFFDKNFNLIADLKGVMIYRYSYDKEGFLIAQEHFGGDFVNPIDDFEGVSKYKFSYDSNGNMISKKNYSKDGALVADCNFVFEYLYEYDKQNRLISQKNFGSLGQLQDDIHGVSVYKYEYNKFGKISKQSNHGPDLRLRDDVGGFSIYKWIYDARGNLIDFQKFDSLGNLI
ncbi:hypothetical protein BLA33_03495 [Borreliella garinii]|uniref:hypothetical protein n=1 Tax=Borreliella garinii TaxID=29519 RepID=UPI000941C36E|nr:hypothetical protein [Borreliella garinii]APQ15390.1 hypothetical protein BLA33_03495 [Borreliella garinii]AZA27612.1 hypothetical protein DB281_00780 [Borreliella garinii]